jgi:hypothetical protein
MKAMFEVLSRENSQHLTLNDNAGVAPVETMIVADDPRAVMWAIFGYSKRHRIPGHRVAVRPLTASEAP